MTFVWAVNGLVTIATLAVLGGWFLAQRKTLDADLLAFSKRRVTTIDRSTSSADGSVL